MKKYLLSFLLIFVSAAFAKASGEFVPRQTTLLILGSNSSYDQNLELKLPDLFEYPDTVAVTDNLDTHGVSVEVTSDNPDMIYFSAYSWYAYQKYNRVQLKQKPKVYGTVNLTVKLTYGSGDNARTVSNVVTYDIVEVIASDMGTYASVGNPCRLDILSAVRSVGSQHLVTRTGSENTVSLSVVDAPRYGTLQADTIHYDNFNKSYYRSCFVYTPAAGIENYTRDSFRYRITLASGNYAEATVEVLVRKNALVARVIEFLPAPGQFTNQSGYTTADCLIGKGSGTTTSSAPQTDGLVSLGGFGGYVILGFDQPIVNDPRHPYGVDFTIGGNSFVADYKGVWTEPGAVMVMRDDNGNGEPDDQWYELAGSDYWFSTTHRNITMTYYDPAYNKRYTVPWTTDNGLAGALLTNQFHEQAYFPDPYIYPAAANHIKDGKLSFTGSLIRSSLDKRVPSYIEFYRCPAFGYCDNKTKQNADLTIGYNPYFDDEKGKSNDGFDISWAVDKDGNYVDLDHIDFIKIYTAGAVNAGWLGEWSTEVTGVGITNPDPDYEPRDYYINYASITQLQVPVGGTCRYEGLAFKNGRPTNEGDPSWWVDDEAIGTIDNSGLFTAKAIGNTNIHFRQYPDAPDDSFEVEVVAMTGVMIDLEGNASTVSNDSLSCIVGETVYINVESLTQNKSQMNGTSSNRYIYDNYTWTNSNPAAGTIDSGTFRALAVGETMLTVRSGIDPSLSDTIKVKVLEKPITRQLQETVRVPYYNARSAYANDKLFTTGNDARVNFEKITSPSSDLFSVESNVLHTDFSAADFGKYPLHVSTSAFGLPGEFDFIFDYYADNYASPLQILALRTDMLSRLPVENPVLADCNLELPSGSSEALATGGAYVWTVRGKELSRFNLTKGEKEAETSLSADGSHSLAVYADRILVTDGNRVRRFYQTDLLPAGEYVAPHTPLAVTADDSYGWAFTAESVEKVSLGLSGIGSLESLPLTGALAGNNAYACNGVAFAPTADGEPLAMIVADGSEVSVIPASGIISAGLSFIDTDSRVIATLGTDRLLHIFDLAEKVWLATGSAFSRLSDLASLLPADVAALSLMPAVSPNESPMASKESTVTVYEKKTSSATRVPTYFFKDHEGDFSVYPRIEKEMDWLTSIERLANGSLKYTVTAPGTVDADSIVSIPLEAIDGVGKSAMTKLNFMFSPRIYKPLIHEVEINAVSSEDISEQMPLIDVFEPQGPTEYYRSRYTYTDQIINSSLPDKVTATIADNILLIKAPAGTDAIGTVTVRRDISHKSYPAEMKSFTASVPVSITRSTQGIEDVKADGTISITPNPARDYIMLGNTESVEAEIFTLSGIRVVKAPVMPGEALKVDMLPAGTYVIRVFDGNSVFTAKMIKI